MPFRRFPRKRFLLWDFQDWKIKKWNTFSALLLCNGEFRCFVYVVVRRAFSRLIKPLDIIIISIIYCSKPRYFSWFRNCKSYWFSNLFLVLRSLLKNNSSFFWTWVNNLWWKWWMRATHAPNLATSGQISHEVCKNLDRLAKFIKARHFSQSHLKTRAFSKKCENLCCLLKTGVSRLK